ncbi:HNH endonuclease, partial [Promicromonospora thailandica]
PDLMVYLTALVPMAQGVQAYAQLDAHARAAKAAGDGRGVGQIMADTLVERVTGRGEGGAGEVPVTVNLLVSDQTLLASGNHPGILVEGGPLGAGVVPGPVVRNLVAHGMDAGAAWLRGIYVDPRGRLVATTSAARFHPPGLSALLRAREQGVCATAWCDAPVRHLDHVTPHAQGGPTGLDNGQGLCQRCNHVKQAPGWSQKSVTVHGRHGVETLAPTGHRYLAVAPRPPQPLRAVDLDAATVPTRAEGDTGMPAGDVQVDGASSTGAAADGEVPAVGERVPGWTPAVGVTGPVVGRVPRSRYQIGCHTRSERATVAYRPSPTPPNTRTAPAPRPAPRPPGRAPRRARRADLTWAHPTG